MEKGISFEGIKLKNDVIIYINYISLRQKFIGKLNGIFAKAISGTCNKNLMRVNI